MDLEATATSSSEEADYSCRVTAVDWQILWYLRQMGEAVVGGEIGRKKKGTKEGRSEGIKEGIKEGRTKGWKD